MKTRNPKYEKVVRDSFAKQSFMAHLGAQLVHVGPGEVHIEVTRSPDLYQQHGYFHAGVTTSIVDSAAGYAALTVFMPDHGVLTTEFKMNLLAPARGSRLLAKGQVIKSGRTLTICRGDVWGEDETHVATGLFTVMQVAHLDD